MAARRAHLLLLILTLASTSSAKYLVRREWADENGGWHGVLGHVWEPTRPKDEDSVLSPVIARLRVDAVPETATRLRVTIGNADGEQSEVPEAVLPAPAASRDLDCRSPAGGCKVRFLPRSGDAFSFAALRLDSRGVGMMFDSSAGPLVVKEQFISITTALPPEAKVFGLMESSQQHFDMQPGEMRTMWAADSYAALFWVNLYGAHPFFVSLSPDGTAHGVLMLNSHGMDIKLSDDGTKLNYKIIGGSVNLYIFSGPTVADVVAQYTEAVGRPAMMPRWSLGFHNCKWGYRSVAELEAVTANYSKAGIPVTTYWADIDYMDSYRDFTTDPVGFPEADFRRYVEDLHAANKRFVVILDPGIKIDENDAAYSEGMAEDIFVRDGFTGKPYTGVVWPGAVHFPDFLHPNSSAWWGRQVRGFVEKIPADGLWVDMNEVSNFCNIEGMFQECHLANESEAAACPPMNSGRLTGDYKGHCCKGTDNRVVVCSTVEPSNKLDFPPYQIRNDHWGVKPLASRSLPPSALHFGGVREYDVHSTYGTLMAKATASALKTARPARRPFVLSRSTFVGHGAHAAHWLGDNKADWEDLRASVRGILAFSLLGVPMVGSDICGFLWDTTAELCSRWIQVGAFAPFSRVHNALGSLPQELYRWESVARSARAALGLRYRLLPYLYTVFYHAHMQGFMVARPLFAVFPGDAQALAAMDSQFMLGDAILVTPVLTKKATAVRGYFPRGRWYSLVDGQPDVDALAAGRWVDLDTPEDRTNVHVRGGRVVPMQREVNTTDASSLDILVALDENGRAEGTLFLDDGEQPVVGRDAVIVDIHVACPALDCSRGSGLIMRNIGVGAAAPSWPLPHIRSLRVLGVLPPPAGWSFSFSLDGASEAPVARYDGAAATIALEGLDLSPLGPHSLFWSAVGPASTEVTQAAASRAGAARGAAAPTAVEPPAGRGRRLREQGAPRAAEVYA